MISFNQIPVGIRTPGTFAEFSNARAAPNLAPWTTRILLLGQKLAGGSQASLQPVQINTKDDGIALFGQGSMLDRMIKALFDVNASTETWAMAVDDNGAGVAATYLTTVTAPPTAAGTLALYIAGQLVDVGITAAMTTAQVATAIAAAINADADLPVTATVAGSVVTSTVRWKGLTGNDVDFRTNYYSTDVMPAGLALATAAGVAGAGNPSAAAAIAALGSKQYHDIVFPWGDGANIALISAEMANRRGPMEMIEGISYTAAKGSQGALATFGESPNSPDLCFPESVGPTPTWERAAREAGLCNYYCSIDPNRPLQTLEMTGDMAPNDSEAFTQTERNALLYDGVSTHKVVSGVLQLERPITTYRLNAQGVADASYLDVTTMKTLSYLRYSFVIRVNTKFPRIKIAKDGTTITPGQAMVTPKTLKAELNALAQDWESAGLVQDLDTFASLLNVEINAEDPDTVDMYIPPDIIPGLRVVRAQIAFAF
ncbi:MAG TPA: phage tail sheath subtilisin-like domain-containing protein [Caulobacteraceae bacterium]|nr:phage tail sheath subtilisin-like domain-containing protein [Caulobacteraceae bacterium]